MNTRFDGVRRFNRLVNNITQEVESEIKELVKQTTLNIEKDAKKQAPVDTSYLRRNIRSKFENDGLVGVVTSNAEYSAYVEYGTSRTPAQPFFSPAVETNVRDFNNKLRNIVGGG